MRLAQKMVKAGFLSMLIELWAQISFEDVIITAVFSGLREIWGHFPPKRDGSSYFLRILKVHADYGAAVLLVPTVRTNYGAAVPWYRRCTVHHGTGLRPVPPVRVQALRAYRHAGTRCAPVPCVLWLRRECAPYTDGSRPTAVTRGDGRCPRPPPSMGWRAGT